MTINVLQGEREFATDNRLLGTFNLEGIPPAPRGVPQIEVTFNIDVNGILTVAAKDIGTGKENKITVQNAGGLTKDEIEKMKRDAEPHAAEDKKRREVIDLKNQGENLAYQTEKQLKEHGDKVSADIRGNIESALNNLRTPSRATTATASRRRWKPCSRPATSSAKRSTRPPAPGGAGPQPASPPKPNRPRHARRVVGGKKKDEDVIDAEYEVKE